MNIRTLLVSVLILTALAGGYFEFIGNNETYEGLTEKIPVIGGQENPNKFLVSYNGSEEYSNIRVTPEYLKLVNKTTGTVQRTYSGGNQTFTLSELDETSVFDFAAKREYIILVSFKVMDPENRSLIYNEIDSMRYKRPVDFKSTESLSISIGIKGAETGDVLIYSPELDYQKASRNIN